MDARCPRVWPDGEPIDMKGIRHGVNAHINKPGYEKDLAGGEIHSPGKRGRAKFERLETAVRAAEEKRYIESQHGPVKVLVKDRKPVGGQADKETRRHGD